MGQFELRRPFSGLRPGPDGAYSLTCRTSVLNSNPSQNSLQRWDNEGGTTKRSRAKHPRDFSQADRLVGDITTGQVENQLPIPEEQGKDLAAVRRGQLGGRERRKISRGSASRAETRTAISQRSLSGRLCAIQRIHLFLRLLC